jgi:hypothetical protein
LPRVYLDLLLSPAWLVFMSKALSIKESGFLLFEGLQCFSTEF